MATSQNTILDLTRVEQKMRRVRVLKQRVDDAVKSTGRDAQTYAIRIAPVDTGALIQSISFSDINDHQCLVYIARMNNPKNGRPTTKYGAIMHNPVHRNVWYSGDRFFMYKARDYGKGRLRTKLLTAIGEILGKNPAPGVPKQG